MNPSLRTLPLLAFLALVAVAGCGDTDPQRLLAESKQSREKGDNKKAFVLVTNALQLDPRLAEARYLLAVIHNDAGDYLSAEKEFRKALELGFDPAQVLAPLAWTLLRQGQYQKVLDETKTAPRSAEILSVRGGAHLGLGQLAPAADAFDQALRLEPQFPPALLGQARLATVERKLDRAAELVDRVLASAPKDYEAWLLAGDLRHVRKDNDKAAAAYGQALQLQAGNVEAYLRRATVFTDAGKFDAAQADIDAARKIAPGNPTVAYAQALLLFRQGKPQPALQALRPVLRIAPDHMPSMLLAGLSHYSLNELAQAERHVKQFLDRSPDSLYARKLLVSILLKSNQGERALETLQPALKTGQQDAQVLAQAGEAHMQLKQFAKAADYLRRAAAMAPTDPGPRTKLGLVALATGKTDSAAAELESAAKLDPGTDATTLLVMTLLGNKDYAKALEAALKLQQKQPANPLTYDLLGGAYLGMKDLANARKSFEQALSLKPDYIPAAMMLAHLDLKANDADRARGRFKAILAKDPNNVQAMTGLARVELAATRDFSKYAAWLEKARSADSRALEPRLLLARHYLNTKNANLAQSVALEASAIQPKDPEVLNLLGEAQAANNDKPGAVTTYASLVNLAPRSPLAHYRLATAQMANQAYDAAAESLKKALSLKADYVDAEAALGVLEHRAGRYSESLRLAQQIQLQAPKLPVGYTLEGDSLMAQQKFALAEKAYEKAFALRQSPALAVKLYAATSQAGKIQEANDRLAQWLRKHPPDQASRLYLADTYVKTGQTRLAIQQYEVILQVDPKNLLAANNLASLYRQEKDPRALTYYEQSYKLKPDNVTIAHNLAWMLVEQGKLERGLELLRKTAAQAPDNPEIRYHLAVALAKSGEKAQARRELERLLANKTDFPKRDEAQALLKQL
jgi:putative PEP-CTERM system TPR-repeat lipoprotein